MVLGLKLMSCIGPERAASFLFCERQDDSPVIDSLVVLETGAIALRLKGF